MSIQQQTASSLPVFTSRYLSFPMSAKSVLVDAKSVLVSLWCFDNPKPYHGSIIRIKRRKQST